MSGDLWDRLERWLVDLIALHSFAVGVFLLFLTEWSTAFGGWGPAQPLFFARQAGVFHLVVAIAYVLEHRRYRGVSLLLLAKSVAVVFLLTATVTGNAPWAVPVSAAGDGLMALAVIWVRSKTRAERR